MEASFKLIDQSHTTLFVFLFLRGIDSCQKNIPCSRNLANVKDNLTTNEKLES